MTKILLAPALAAILFFQTGCSATTGQILSAVEQILTVAAGLAPVLQTFGVTPAITAEVTEYTQDAVAATAACASVLSTPGNAETLSLACATAVSKAVAPKLDPGTPQAVVVFVGAIAAGLQNMLASMPAPVIKAPVAASPKLHVSLASSKPSAPGSNFKKQWNPGKDDRLALSQAALAAGHLAASLER
jgi:hypothetical protein